MADSCSEDEKLRQQIAFLTQLINSASGSSDGNKPGKGSSSHANIADTSGHHQHISKPTPRQTSGYYGPQSRSAHEGNFSHATTAEKEAAVTDPSKFSWSRTKSAGSFVNRKENKVLVDKPSPQLRSQSAVSGQKSFASNLRTGPTIELKKTVSGGKTGSVGHADVKHRISSVPTVPASSSIPQTATSNYITSMKQHTSGQISNFNQHQGKTIPSSASSIQLSIQQRLLEAEKTIQDLKKDLEKRTSQVDNNTRSSSENLKLQSLSPYKLQKVPSSSSSSVTVAPNLTAHKQKSVLMHGFSSKHYQSRTSSIPTLPKTDCDPKPSAIQPALPVIKSTYSLKRVSSAPSLTYSSQSHFKPQKQTPSKLVLKTRFALKRERTSSSSNSSNKKTTGIRSQPTPSKFARVSRYSLKRIRRSLSDESKIKKQRAITDSPFATNNSNTQYAARVIRTKYKVQKVFRGQQQQQQVWSTDRGRQTKYGNSGPGWKAHQSTRGRWRQGSGYYPYRQPGKGFQQNHWIFAHSRQQAVYRGHKQYHHSSSRSLPWRQRQLQYPAPGFISQKYVKRRLARLKQQVPFNPKMKVDRRTPSPQKSLTGRAGVSMVVVNGMLYKSNAKPGPSRSLHQSRRPSHRKDTRWSKIRHARATSMRTISVRGVTFSMGNDGKKLTRVAPASTSSTEASTSTGMTNPRAAVPVTRVDFGGVTYIQTKPGTLERLGSAQTRKMASRVVNRTVAQVAARSHKLVKKQYCMFYNRFGKCNKSASCPFIHDPEKVAVCTRFLRGTCKLKGCPFSHKVSPGKMPVCSYFLKGVCNKDDCPYRHVNVNRDAEVCSDFVRGYCPQGDKCKKKHVLVCAEFSKTGKCKDGRKCKLQHRRRKRKSVDNKEGATPAKLRKRTISTSNTDKTVQPVIDVEHTNGMKTNDRKSDDRKAEDRKAEDKDIKDRKADDIGADNTGENDRKEQPAVPDDSHLPFKERKLPAYISLNLKKEPKATTTLNSSGQNKPVMAATTSSPRSQDKAIRIRPQL